MNTTVITTGPGVIIATATASTNCCSLSHPNCCTTPWWRNGTMARPLPNTKAPALVKNARICRSGCWPPTLTLANHRSTTITIARVTAPPISAIVASRRPGRVRANTMTSPAITKNSASSARAHTVRRASAPKIVHRSGSRLFVERASLYAAIAMMAITAAPMP